MLCCGTEPWHQLEAIEKSFQLKDGTIADPTLYLGADIGKYVFEDGTFSWSLCLPIALQRQLKLWKMR